MLLFFASLNVAAETIKIKGKRLNVIDVVKAYPVDKLKSGMVSYDFAYQKLHSVPLEKWLASTLKNIPLQWSTDGCASMDSDIEDNPDYCDSYSVIAKTLPEYCPEVELNFDVDRKGGVHFLNDNSAVMDFGAAEYPKEIAGLEKALVAVEMHRDRHRSTDLIAPSLQAMSKMDIESKVRILDVHLFDSSLPSEGLANWLSRVTGQAGQWSLITNPKNVWTHCENTRLVVRGISDHVWIDADMGSWEQGFDAVPKLEVSVYDDEETYAGKVLERLSTLPKELVASRGRRAQILAAKPALAHQVKTPQAQSTAAKSSEKNMSWLGYFRHSASSSSGHCDGYFLELWQYKKQVFGTLFNPDGQCADSPAPTYMLRDVKLDAQTGKLEFQVSGDAEYKFSGVLHADKVIGRLSGSAIEDIKLKRDKDKTRPQDSDQNIQLWCAQAHSIYNIQLDRVQAFCASMGVQ